MHKTNHCAPTLTTIELLNPVCQHFFFAYASVYEVYLHSLIAPHNGEFCHRGEESLSTVHNYTPGVVLCNMYTSTFMLEIRSLEFFSD